MSLVVLGLSGALTHDPSAALYIDGELIAAAEEERFTRQKHATYGPPAQFRQDFVAPNSVEAF